MGKVAFYSSAWRGGSGWFVQALAQSLADAGTDVILLAPTAEPEAREPSSPNLTRIRLGRGTAGQGGLLARIFRTLVRILANLWTLLWTRRKAKDYLITHPDWTAVLSVQMLLLRLLGARITYIVHDATPHAWTYPARLRGLEVRILRLTYGLPHHIVVLSPRTREALIHEYRLAAEKVTVIPHGAFVPDVQSELSGNSTVLIFGMLRRNKRILESIEAINALPASSSIRAVIAGEPHGEDREYWVDCERALSGDKGRIRREIGFVPESRVPELLAECDALLVPYEGFQSQSGVAILAAFGNRILIGTDVGGIGDLVELGLEIVPVAQPVTAASIREALLEFETLTREERRAMAARSREALGTRLDWANIAVEYQTLFAKNGS